MITAKITISPRQIVSSMTAGMEKQPYGYPHSAQPDFRIVLFEHFPKKTMGDIVFARRQIYEIVSTILPAA